jgi:glycosyltransferase involved in cell wall biosynthesis
MSSRTVPKRVLQVIEASLGGTRRYLEDVFGALGDGPHNGLVYSLHRADGAFLRLLENLRKAGWTLYEVDMRRNINLGHDLACTRALRGIYRSFRPDVVHAHSSKAGAIARLATVGLRHRPGIVYTPNAIGVNLNWIYRPIEHLLALRLDIMVAVTASERDELRALRLVPPDRVHIVVPTIRSDVFVPGNRVQARRDLNLCDGPIVIAIGRLTQQKDPLAFVDFFAALRKKVHGVRAIWVGEGELRAAMQDRIDELGLQRSITIAGWQEDVRPYLAACDLFVSTAIYESFGYVTAEALAMDRPVVASAITGTIDIVTTDVSDQLYRYQDIDAAAELAERLLMDIPHAKAVAARGRMQVLSTFSVAEMQRSLATAYAAAVHK